jgi:hypothetical protein
MTCRGRVLRSVSGELLRLPEEPVKLSAVGKAGLAVPGY